MIILGKGAAYAQADDAIRSFVEKSGVPFLPMSMAKGLLPDTHPQCAGAARSTVLKESDVVMLIGARLNWLLSHGKGKTWGEAPKKFIQIDIEPKEMDSMLMPGQVKHPLPKYFWITVLAPGLMRITSPMIESFVIFFFSAIIVASLVIF